MVNRDEYLHVSYTNYTKENAAIVVTFPCCWSRGHGSWCVYICKSGGICKGALLKTLLHLIMYV